MVGALLMIEPRPGAMTMRGMKLSVFLAALGVVGLALWAGAFVDQTGTHMSRAASRFLAALDKEQAAKATYSFDSDERVNWHFIPRERNGLPIKAMTPAQRALAFGLIQSGVTSTGYLKATTIMSLEQVLKEIEKPGGLTRDPELYFVTIFGTPSDRGRWGWRVEGHHISLNFALQDGKIVASTPCFFGANPAEIRQGPRQGLRTLADIEDRALRLLQALDSRQAKEAVVDDTAPKDIRAAHTLQPPTDSAVGIAYADLNGTQRQMMQALVESYTVNMPGDVAGAWLDEIKQAGPETVRFAWFGPADRSQPHGYRVQGPTFLIEFNNTQNGANHIHSVWRNMLGDFGIPLKK
jgi:hypothetical protein